MREWRLGHRRRYLDRFVVAVVNERSPRTVSAIVELAAQRFGGLVKRQRPDGSWANTNAQWFESDANLVTGYSILALSYCRPNE